MYKNKIFNVMVIFLLWLGLVCCGVANGLIYDNVQTLQSYYYMVIPSAIAVMILIIHRICTRNWCDSGDNHHSSIFGGSAVISFVMVIASLFASHTGDVSSGFLVGCLTVMIAFSIAAIKERSYA